jgi:hypothetical protein
MMVGSYLVLWFMGRLPGQQPALQQPGGLGDGRAEL